MARIIAYQSTTPATDDLLLGTQKTTSGTNNTNPTKNFTVDSVVQAGLGYTVYTALVTQTGTGAPVAVHSASSSIIHEATRDSMNKDRLKNGNYLENTASYFVIISKEKSAETALLTMKSTQLKVSKTWNSLMSGLKLQGSKGLFTPPMFSHVYNLKTVQQSNDKGTWFGWTVSKVGPVQNQGLYEQAKAFAESIKSGEVQAKHSREETKASSNIPEDL